MLWVEQSFHSAEDYRELFGTNYVINNTAYNVAISETMNLGKNPKSVNCHQETTTLSIKPNLEILSVGKDTSRRTLQRHWKGPHKELLTNPCTANLQGTDSWVHMTHLRKHQALTACTPGDLKIDFLELKQMTLNKTAFSRCLYHACAPLLTVCCSYLFHGNKISLSAFPKPLQEWEIF